jgi:flavin-dependent dehydrogenase
MNPQETDVLIIGAGPAGSTAAAILAEAGLSVCIVEKDNFPRFKIGESLLPGGNRVLERIGVWDKMDDAGFIRKYGAEFISSDGATRVHNIFAKGLFTDFDYTYQVERSRFDALLLNNATDKGAQLMQPCKVINAELQGGHWLVDLQRKATESSTESRVQYRSKWLLDASGRAAFFCKQNKLQQDEIPYPKRFAVYNHFTGIPRSSGSERGNIIISRLPDGWFWVIPLSEEKTSVGVVALRKRDEWKNPDFSAQTFFDNEVQRAEYLRELLMHAKPLDEFRVTTDYSYSFKQYAGQQHLLLGDAAGFLDPIFSSGVFLALSSADRAADKILVAHAHNRTLTAKEYRHYTRSHKQDIRLIRELIDVYYDNKGYSVFMSPTERFKLFQSVNAVVGGSVSPGFNLWWRLRLFFLICKINRFFRLVPDQLPD